MVSTRSHPTPLPGPSSASPSKAVAAIPSRAPRSGQPKRGSWSHTPTPLTILWLLISLPLVLWDTGYVIFRPHTFPGGAMYYPLYVPYALYGFVDQVYGQKAFYDRNGFTAAQAWLNAVETAGYLAYLWLVLRHGGGNGGPNGILGKVTKTLGFDGAVGGGWGGIACLIGFSMSVMTISKTVLYGLNEYCSDFKDIRHNDPLTLFACWIFPNGMWLVLPPYMAYVLAVDLLDGLAMASGDSNSLPARAAIMAKED